MSMIWLGPGLPNLVRSLLVQYVEVVYTNELHETNVPQGFYDPLNDKLLEPNLTGISYSFDDKGHYEEAYYRAVSNRQSSVDI
jgi:hypothetical protein